MSVVPLKQGGASDPLRWYKVKKPVHLQSILLMHVQIQMSLRVQTNTELTARAFHNFPIGKVGLNKKQAVVS
jgi:hypothetical protein